MVKIPTILKKEITEEVEINLTIKGNDHETS